MTSEIEQAAARERKRDASQTSGMGEWAAPPVEELAPTELADWVCPSTVLTWSVNEVARLARTPRPSATQPKGIANYRGKVMAAVLAYAYARQMYDPEAIARACRTDPTLKVLCAAGAPFAGELQRFRRQKRDLIERVLARVFLRALCHRFDLVGFLLPAELENDLRRLAAERLDIARHMETAAA